MEPGKQFEQNLKKSLPGIIRLYDTTNGFAGIKNPCDFIYYVYPYDYLIECKSVKGQRFDFSNLTDNQKEQLEYYDHIYGVTSLVCIEFREVQKCFAIPYKLIKQLNEEGKKSIHYMKDNSLIQQYEMPTKYARVNFKLNQKEFNKLLKGISEVRE